MRHDRVVDWVRRNEPDVLCMQELKVADDQFPGLELTAAGYQLAIHGQKGYNGVAIASRVPLTDVTRGFADDDPDDHARVIAATAGPLRVIAAYFPNGEKVGSDKFAYKLRWMARLRAWLDRAEKPDRMLALVGDFNVAPEDRDVWDPKLWRGKVLFTDEEKAALARVREFGFHDAFRAHRPEPDVYTYWDYRGSAVYLNQGLRIDHVYATAPLLEICRGVEVDRAERKGKNASDHAPVTATFELLA